MAASVLTRVVRRLNIFKNDLSIANVSTQQVKPPVGIAPAFLRSIKDEAKHVAERACAFNPHSIILNFDMPRARIPPASIRCPVLPVQIDDPKSHIIDKSDIRQNTIIETPPDSNIIEKRAERLVVIRRKKIKKHHRRKLLKKLTFLIRKKKFDKKQLKRKIFEAELNSIHLEAKRFDAKKYVAERLQILTREIVPSKFRGEKLPEAMVRQLMEEKQKRIEHKHRIRTYRLRPDLGKAALQKGSANPPK
ncbi:hypothetical protein QAD02_015144 [Eretmocerus hayati]|uniref:Uncharacterized protein n=1 Tax=Eretmocerus hayati TaxID=131215 RepID=A0ACC2P7U2_9HYME|nr:hypothetical protein QAD02_015144 [Eretmocerus hayati]